MVSGRSQILRGRGVAAGRPAGVLRRPAGTAGPRRPAAAPALSGDDPAPAPARRLGPLRAALAPRLPAGPRLARGFFFFLPFSCRRLPVRGLMKVETGRFLIVDCFWFVFISTLQKEGDQWSCYFKFAAAGGADEERPTGAEPELTHNPQRGFRVLKTTSDQRLCFPYPSYAYVPRIKTKKKTSTRLDSIAQSTTALEDRKQR